MTILFILLGLEFLALVLLILQKDSKNTMKILKGNRLQLWLHDNNETKTLIFATAHTLSVTGNTESSQNKDSSLWNFSEIGSFDWEITADCLYTDNSYDLLFDLMLAGEPIQVTFSEVLNYDNNGLVRGGNTDTDAPTEWVPDPDKARTGYVIVSALNENANSGENATFSVTFTGTGPLVKDSGSTPDEENIHVSNISGWMASSQIGAKKLTAYFNATIPSSINPPADYDISQHLTVQASGDHVLNLYQGNTGTQFILEYGLSTTQTSFNDTFTLTYDDPNIGIVYEDNCNEVKWSENGASPQTNHDPDVQEGTQNP